MNGAVVVGYIDDLIGHVSVNYTPSGFSQVPVQQVTLVQ